MMSKGNEFEFQKGAGTKPECDGNYGGKNRDHTCHGTALTQKFIDFRGLLEFLSKHAAGAVRVANAVLISASLPAFRISISKPEAGPAASRSFD